MAAQQLRGRAIRFMLGYIPEADYAGADMLIVQVPDGRLADFITVNMSIEAFNDGPMVGDIPDQIVYVGQSFNAIPLDFYVEDVNNADAEIVWRVRGVSQLSVSIVNRVATITVLNPEWIGSETITFRATDPGGLYDEDSAMFTVSSGDPPQLNYICLPLIIK